MGDFAVAKYCHQRAANAVARRLAKLERNTTHLLNDERITPGGQLCGVENRRSGGSLPVALGAVFTAPPQSGLA